MTIEPTIARPKRASSRSTTADRGPRARERVRTRERVRGCARAHAGACAQESMHVPAGEALKAEFADLFGKWALVGANQAKGMS